VSGGWSPGDKWVHTRAFPGIISAWKVSLGELLTYTNPRLVVEEGAKVNPGGAAERCRNVGPGAALDMQCATGTATDRFVQVKECTAEAVLRSKGLKDAMCMGWFGDDWDCLVGCPPKAMIT